MVPTLPTEPINMVPTLPTEPINMVLTLRDCVRSMAVDDVRSMDTKKSGLLIDFDKDKRDKRNMAYERSTR
jgi:hypothetical protein